MKNFFWERVSIARIFMIAALAAGLTACGGDDDGPGPADITYTGSTSAAVVSNDNAPPISIDATSTGANSSGGVMGVAGSGTAKSPMTDIISQVVSDAVKQQKLNGTSLMGATVSETQAGTCGGTASASGTISDVEPYDFNLSFDFNNYCEEGFIIAGDISAIGSITFTPTFAFTMAYTSNQLVLREVASGTTYMYQNLSVSLATDDFFDTTHSISGTFYHPDYGYVSVTTLTPFQIKFLDLYPSAGVMEIRDGTNLVVLTALPGYPQQYRLDIDYGDNGSIDVTATRDWTDTSPLP